MVDAQASQTRRMRKSADRTGQQCQMWLDNAMGVPGLERRLSVVCGQLHRHDVGDCRMACQPSPDWADPRRTPTPLRIQGRFSCRVLSVFFFFSIIDFDGAVPRSCRTRFRCDHAPATATMTSWLHPTTTTASLILRMTPSHHPPRDDGTDVWSRNFVLFSSFLCPPEREA